MTDPLPLMNLLLGLGQDPADPAPTMTSFPSIPTPPSSDRWTGQQFNITQGRPNELEQMQAATITVTLDNSARDSVPAGALTPGNAASPYYPDVDTDIRLQLKVTPSGVTTFQIFDGFVESWKPDMQGGFDYATVDVTAVDAQQILSLQALTSSFVRQLLLLGPVAYYPLSEASGTTFGDLTGTQRAARLVRDGNPASTFQMAQAALSPADPAASLDLEATYTSGLLVDTDGGWYVSFPRTATVTASGGLTVVIAFQTSSSIPMTLWEQWSATGQTQFRLFLTDGQIWFGATADNGAFSTAISVATFNDGLPHLAVATFSSDRKTTTVRVDGVQVATYTAASALTITSSVGGSNVGASTPGLFTRRWIGLVGHPALFNTALSSTDCSNVWKAFTGWPGELAGARIGRLLDAAGWPAAQRTIEAGASPLGPSLTADVDALTAIQNTAAAEDGLFFISRNGKATFHGRGHRLDKALSVTLGTSTLPVNTGGLTFDLSNTFIRNDVTGTRPGGATVRRTNQASIDKHQRRTDTLNVELGNDDELLYAVQWRLARYASPRILSGDLTINPLAIPALWPYFSSLQIGDRIAVTNLPASAPAATMSFFIEGRRVEADRDSFLVIYTVSPGDQSFYFKPDDPVYGAVDSYPIAW